MIHLTSERQQDWLHSHGPGLHDNPRGDTFGTVLSLGLLGVLGFAGVAVWQNANQGRCCNFVFRLVHPSQCIDQGQGLSWQDRLSGQVDNCQNARPLGSPLPVTSTPPASVVSGAQTPGNCAGYNRPLNSAELASTGKAQGTTVRQLFESTWGGETQGWTQWLAQGGTC